MYERFTPEGKDPQIWQMAMKRAAFKRHLGTYVIMSIFFWVIWALSGNRAVPNSGLPWPVWPMLGWGIGVLFHYFSAYGNTGANAVEKEYDKLKSKNNL